MDDLRSRWAANLVEARTRAKLTQAAVADRLGVSQQAVVEWEKGRTVPTPERQAQLVALYGREPRDLFPLEAA